MLPTERGLAEFGGYQSGFAVADKLADTSNDRMFQASHNAISDSSTFNQSNFANQILQ